MKRRLWYLIVALCAVAVSASAQWVVPGGTARRVALSPSVAFADLPSSNNGTMLYCSDCTAGSPCTGSGTGAIARREAGAWNCGGGGGAEAPLELTGTVNETQLTVTGPNDQSGALVEIVNVADDADGAYFSMWHDSASPAAADYIGGIQFFGEDAGGNKTEYASQYARIVDTTGGSEDGEVLNYVMIGGTLRNVFTWGASNGPFITGFADVPQLTVRGHSSQADYLVLFEKSDGTDRARFNIAETTDVPAWDLVGSNADGASGGFRYRNASQSGAFATNSGYGSFITYASGVHAAFSSDGIQVASTGAFRWNNGAIADQSYDTGLERDAAGVVAASNGGSGVGSFRVRDTNGGSWTNGSSSELITLSTSGTTTNSSANLLPANSIIHAVTCRITTTIADATDWSVGDTTTAARFSSANATLTAGTTSVGLNHMKGGVSTEATGPTQTSATTLRITTTGTPSAGAVRCTSFYSSFVAPTS